MTAPTQDTRGGQAGPRRLVRTSDGKLGGVAAGVGHYLGIDPTIVRLGFVALAFAGGLGLLLYVIGWIVIPKGEIDEPGREQPLDGWLVVGVVGIVAGVGLLFGWHGIGDAGRAAIAVALVVGGVLLLGRSRGLGGGTGGSPVTPSPPPGPSSPTQSDDAPVGAPEPSPGETTAVTTAPIGPEPEAPGRRVPVTAGVISVLAIAAALLLAGVLSDWFALSASTVLAAALVVVGAGLILAAVVGSAPWLFVVATLLTCALLVGAAVEPWVDDGVGERIYRPTSSYELKSEYRLGAGNLTVDLTGAVLPRTATVVVRLGAGQATIRVPQDVDVDLRSHVGAGRLESANGLVADGFDKSLDVFDDVPGERGLVVLDLNVGFGEGTVARG